jgi:hypothetical protein
MTFPLRGGYPTPTWLRLAIVPVLAFLATVTDRHYLADFWHHLARGRAIVTHGSLVDRDLFTFTVADQPFQDVNWLTQVGYYALFQVGGLPLVQCVNSLLLAVTFAWLVQLARRRSGSLLAAVLVGAFAFFGVWEVLTIRPQTLSLLLFVVLFDLLEHSEHQPRWLLAVAPLMALWANVHGAFPAGLILMGCFWVTALWHRRDPWRWSAALAGSFLATLANPYGWNIYRYVTGTSAIAYQRQIAEWVAPAPDRMIGVLWLLSVALVLSLLLWRWLQTRQRPALRDVLLLGCFLTLSCGSVRMVAWWTLVSAPLLAELLVWAVPRLAAPDPDAQRPTFLVGGVFGLIVLAVIFSLPGLAHFNPLLGQTRSGPRVEEDLDNVQHHLPAPSGNIYTHFEWGEYVSWSAPEHKVFMDGRIEIYPDAVWDKYTTVTFARTGWQKILDEYGVDYLILDTDYHGKTGLLDQVSGSPCWQRVAQSRQAVLYVRHK